MNDFFQRAQTKAFQENVNIKKALISTNQSFPLFHHFNISE